MSGKTFAEYERDGWERNASDYDEIDLPATGRAIDPLLESLGNLKGQRLLDIASGTGHLAKAAVARGATVVGIDVATNMIELARKLVPGATFQEGNGEALPFEDETFSAVACSFGLLPYGTSATQLRVSSPARTRWTTIFGGVTYDVAPQIRMGHGRCAKIWPQLRLTKAWSRRAEACGSCQAFGGVMAARDLVIAEAHGSRR